MCFGTGSIFIDGQQDSSDGIGAHIEDILIMEENQSTEAGAMMVAALAEIAWVCNCKQVNINADNSKNGINMDQIGFAEIPDNKQYLTQARPSNYE